MTRQRKHTPLPADLPTLTLAQINSKLEPFATVSEKGLQAMGFTPVGRIKECAWPQRPRPGTYYLEAAMPLIRAALVKHISSPQ